jgi:uncharacterized membrane protein
MNLWRRFVASQRGNMVVMFAAGFAVSAVVAAFAVDAGGLYYERRAVQNGVDLAALEAASSAATAQSIAHKSLQNAGLMTAASLAGLTVVTGRYDPNPAVAAANRFVANATPTNAVQVSFSKPGTLYFANGWAEPPTISATAIATVTPQVAFSVGSRLAKVEGGAINGLLNGLLGTNISLTALDYNGLVGAQVDLFAFLDKLANRLGVSVGTYNDLLAMRADHGQLAMALADLLTGTQRTAMLKLANAAGHNGTLPIGKLLQLGGLGDFDIGTGAANGLFTKISALDLLSASASLSDGKHQVNVGIDLKVPGLLDVTTTVAVGEPPQGGSWYAIGPTNTVVRTAQVRLSLLVELKLSLLLLPLIEVKLPLYVQVAHSEASVASAICPTSGNTWGSAVINARPGAAKIVVGEVTNFNAFDKPTTESPTKLLTLLGIPITAFAKAEIAQLTPVPLSFSSSEIAARTVKTAKTTTILGSLLTTLLGNLQLGGLLGLGSLLSGALVPALNVLLAPLGPALDPIITGLLDALGVSIGEADVQVYGVRCTHPVLVG